MPAARRRVPQVSATTSRKASSPVPVPAVPDGPGRIAPGQRVTCLPGSLPAREGGRGGGLLVSIGLKTSVVDVYGGRRRRISNELLHPQAGPTIALDRRARGLRTTTASGRGWLPGWSWLDWTIVEHVAYQQGRRQLPTPPPAPTRLVIVACGARKTPAYETPAGQMYTGSYHKAARRAADTIAASAPGTRVMILSAMYGLVDLDELILRYDLRLGHRYAITAQGLREQVEQLGMLDTAEVVVLAPAAYADLATHVWPHAQRPLAGTRGIGDQMARLKALAVDDPAVAPPASSDDPPETGTAATFRPAVTGADRAGAAAQSPTPGRTRPHQRRHKPNLAAAATPGCGAPCRQRGPPQPPPARVHSHPDHKITTHRGSEMHKNTDATSRYRTPAPERVTPFAVPGPDEIEVAGPDQECPLWMWEEPDGRHALLLGDSYDGGIGYCGTLSELTEFAARVQAALEAAEDRQRAGAAAQDPPRSRTYTVLGVWDGKQPVPVGVVEGEHEVTGGAQEHWEQGLWATSVTAADPTEAETAAVAEMHTVG